MASLYDFARAARRITERRILPAVGLTIAGTSFGLIEAVFLASENANIVLGWAVVTGAICGTSRLVSERMGEGALKGTLVAGCGIATVSFFEGSLDTQMIAAGIGYVSPLVRPVVNAAKGYAKALSGHKL